MAITVPQARLILKSIMAGLRNNLAASDLIDWETHSAEMNDRNGYIVSEQVGPEYVITETTGAVQDLTSGVQDTVFGSQTFTLNRVFGLSMGASDIESITSLAAARKSRALNNGMERLASRIDAHIFQTAAEAFPWSTGVWGTNLTDPEEFAAARTRLAEASVESDSGINGVIKHIDRQKLAKFIYNDNASLMQEGQRAMRTGFSGALNGIPTKVSNQLGRVVTGTRTNGLINGAAQNVAYTAASDSGTNAGRYLTQNIILDGVGTTGSINKGEVFTIAGVNAWDPDLGASREFLQQFVVLDNVVASGGNVTVAVFPAMIVGDGTTTIGAAGVNNAHRTIDVAPADNAVVTFEGSASTSYTPRMMWKRDCIVAHSAPLIMPYTGQGFRRSLADAQRDNVAPLMPRLWLYSDPNTGAHRARIDVFIQAQARDRWKGIKFFGGGL